MAVYLRILQGAGTGQVLPVPNGQPVTLGRSASASYAFDDPLLSRRHCAVETRGELCRIVDLQSRNGTFVNGQRVGAVLLRVGDRIKIGNLLIEVAPSGAAPASPQPSFRGGGQPAMIAAPAAPTATQCQGCGAAFGPSLPGRELRGRALCPPCVDRFDIEEDLVEGFKLLERREVTSFGVTYLARQLLMDRTVILKTLQQGPESDPKSLKRFMREAKTGGRLTHPNIVELYDVNEQDGILYIVTEYVDGQNLGKVLQDRRGPLPGPDVLRVMYQIADALAYAHDHQIVHRDVRPGNILIRRGDHVGKLQGFTLAKNLERAGMSVITADGESLGTPYYMAPEQVRSAKDATPQSDLYSWAATTYHCLAGKLPLEARSYGEFIDKVFNHDPPRLETHVASAPAALSDLLARCMRREASERPETLRDVQQGLDPILRALQPT